MTENVNYERLRFFVKCKEGNMVLFLLFVWSLVTSSNAANPNLKWMSFYDFDPDVQHGWSYGTSYSIYDINQAWLKYKMSSLFVLPQTDGNVSACTEHANLHPI